MNKEKIFEKLGFRKNWIYEVIVTTTDENGKVNAAPMGIYTENFETIKLEVYKNSKTCENILSQKEFVANFVNDLEVFYHSIFSKDEVKYGDKNVKNVNAPVLHDATVWLELEVRNSEDLGESIVFSSDIISYGVVNKRKISLLNRAEGLTLESLIKITKKRFLREEIEENLRVIKKVAPNSKYEEIMREILRKSEKFEN